MNEVKIILAEDESIIAMDVQNMLMSLGYRVINIVSTGEDAIEKAKELKPDLILMDIILAGTIDGVEATKIIKKETGIPVVYLTAHGDVSTIIRARETEPYGYIMKPINSNDLFSTIDTALYRFRLESRLRESEERFRLAMEAADEGLWDWDAVNHSTYYSPGWTKILGYTSDEMKNDDNFWYSILHPDSQNESKGKTISHLKNETDAVQGEYKVKHKDGRWLWISVRGQAVHRNENGSVTRVIGTIKDITSRRKSEEEIKKQNAELRALLQELEATSEEFEATNEELLQSQAELMEKTNTLKTSEAFLSNIFNSIQDGILVIDKDMNIIRANHWIEEHFVSEKNLSRKKCYEALLGKKDICKNCPAVFSIETGEPHQDTITYKMENNNYKYCEISSYPLIDANGNKLGAIEHIRDISETRQMEKKLASSDLRYRMLVENLPVPFFIHCDEDIIYINNAAIDLLGETNAKDLIGKSIWDIIHSDSHSSYKDNFKAVYEKKACIPNHDVKLNFSDGKVFNVKVMHLPIEYEGKPAAQTIFSILNN